MIQISNMPRQIDLFQNPMLNPINRFNSNQNTILNRNTTNDSQDIDNTNGSANESELNSEFANALARSAAYIPDTVYRDVNSAPPSEDSAEWLDWNQQNNEFNTQAANITQQRIGLYNQMMQNGSSGNDIFQAIVNFNNGLPMDYQAKAGLASIDITV